MDFEWDETKQRANVAKHGIDFADAKEVFDDPSAYTILSHAEAANVVTLLSVR
jgi:uncharacterized DUF497 family protein